MDMVTIPVGSFFRDVERAAIVEVVPDDANQKPGQPKMARVIEPMRGMQVGEPLTFAGAFPPNTILPGQKLLFACSKKTRYCVYGLSRAGYYELSVDSIGHDTVQIPPGMIEPPALRAFLAGQPAQASCAFAHVELTDDPDGFEVWPLQLAAADGKGTARRGQQAGAAAYDAKLQVFEGRSAISVTTPAGKHLSLYGAAPRFGKDGCYTIYVAPVHPLARTPQRLSWLLNNAPADQVLARGTVQVNAGAAVPAGSYPITVEWTERGTRFRCPLFSDEQARMLTTPLGPRLLSFPLRESYLSIELERGADIEAGLNLARALPLNATRSFPLRQHNAGNIGAVIGTVSLTHVKDQVPQTPSRRIGSPPASRSAPR